MASQTARESERRQPRTHTTHPSVARRTTLAVGTIFISNCIALVNSFARSCLAGAGSGVVLSSNVVMAEISDRHHMAWLLSVRF